MVKYLERNYRLIQDRMIEQMEKSLKIGKELIDSELDAGILDFIVKPIVKTFYKYWSDNDARVGTLQQIKVTLDTAKNLLENGASDEYFDKLVKQNFSVYLNNDQTYKQCKKNHANYQNLKENTKNAFVSQVKDSIKYLKVDKENIQTYDDLTKEVFKTKEEAYNTLIRQLDFNEGGIKVVEKDPSILSIPTGKNVIVKALRKGFDQTKRDLLDGLNRLYPNFS